MLHLCPVSGCGRFTSGGRCLQLRRPDDEAIRVLPNDLLASADCAGVLAERHPLWVRLVESVRPAQVDALAGPDVTIHDRAVDLSADERARLLAAIEAAIAAVERAIAVLR